MRFVGYWFDMPTVARGTGLANAMANSGAGRRLIVAVASYPGSSLRRKPSAWLKRLSAPPAMR